MVRATRTDAKTQTRRIINPQPKHMPILAKTGVPMRNPYGTPGDRLWVREEHRTLRFNRDTREAEVEYTEDGSRRTVTLTEKEAALFVGRKFPFAQTRARFMYRSYSRITLEIVSVRVERLQDISEADAVAEGITACSNDHYHGWLLPNGEMTLCPRYAYQALWESINGPDSWATNPYVWCVSFKRVEGGSK